MHAGKKLVFFFMARNSRFLLLRRGLRVWYKKGGLPPLGSVIRAVMAHTHTDTVELWLQKRVRCTRLIVPVCECVTDLSQCNFACPLHSHTHTHGQSHTNRPLCSFILYFYTIFLLFFAKASATIFASVKICILHLLYTLPPFNGFSCPSSFRIALVNKQ